MLGFGGTLSKGLGGDAVLFAEHLAHGLPSSFELKSTQLLSADLSVCRRSAGRYQTQVSGGYLEIECHHGCSPVGA